MNSQEAQEYVRNITGGSFGNWIIFNEECLHNIPNQQGIYLMRFRDRNIGRVCGTTDIYYIGSSDNLRGRLRGHWRGDNYGYAQPVVERLYRTGYIEISWLICDNQNCIQQAEHECLIEFFNKHLELPPGNAQLPPRRARIPRLPIPQHNYD